MKEIKVTWFDELKMEMENVEAMPEPPYALDEGDVVVGVLETETTRKLFTLSQQYRRRFEEARLRARFDGTLDEEAAEAELSELDAKADALKDLFWTALRAEFKLWGNYAIGIRRGWQVTKKPAKSSGPQGLFRRLGLVE